MTAWALIGLAVFQQAPTPSVFGGRYDGLRYLFAERRIEPSSKRAFLETPRAEWRRWTVVLLDDCSLLSEVDIPWDQFVRGGGSLWIATDREFDGVDLMLARIVGGPISVSERHAFGGRELCPTIVRFRDQLGLNDGVRAIVGNRTGHFASSAPGWESMGWLPDSARQPEGFLRSSRPFYGARVWEAGRLAIVADQSIFSNEMLLEADNCRFAANLVNWLTDGGKKDRALFVEAGTVVDEWIDPRFEEGRWPRNDLEGFLALINDEILPSLNRSDVLNGIVGDLQASIAPRQAARLIGLGSGLLVLLAVVGAIMRSRLPDSRAKAISSEKPASLDSSTRQVLRSSRDDYSDVACRMARAFMAEEFGADWQSAIKARQSRFDWPWKRTRAKRLAEVAKVATGKSRGPVHGVDLQRLQKELNHLADSTPKEATQPA